MSDRKEQLKSMLQNFIQDNNEGAQLDFHQYVSGKMNDITAPKQEKDTTAVTETETD